MKIDGRDNNIVNLDKAFSGDRVRKSERDRNAEQAQKGEEQKNACGDVVNISSQGAQIQQIKSMMQDIPDVREDRVNAVKEYLKSGEYQVGCDKVAQAIIVDNLQWLFGSGQTT